MPSRWSELPDLYGHDVINVLGGGPSVKPYVDRLREVDGPWIGACRAGLLIKAEITMACDGRFPKQCADEIDQALSEGQKIVHPVRPHVKPEQVAHIDPRITIIGWKTRGVSTTPKEVRGLDSGFAAFNAALIYRPKLIRLFGLDYCAPAGQERFHDGYPGTQVKAYDRSLWSWANQYDQHIKAILGFGVDIVNYTGDPQSRINRFERRPLTELFP